MLFVLFLVLRVNQQIVQVCYHEFVQVWSQHIVDEGLEARRCVGESERHYGVLIVSVSRSECCLPFVTLLDPYLMIGFSNVQLRKNSCLAGLFSQLVNEWQWVAVLDRNIVQLSIVDTESQ